jgi:hypothetical protein
MITNCIIVGLDDSAASRAAHRWAAEYAYAVGKDLCAVHVLDWPIGLNASALDHSQQTSRSSPPRSCSLALPAIHHGGA